MCNHFWPFLRRSHSLYFHLSVPPIRKMSAYPLNKSYYTNLTKCFGGHSITKHTGGGGVARRSESKTPKYLSKNRNIRKMLKSYPLNILKVQSKSSKISNLGQIFIFTENCTPNYPYESFSLPLTIVQINIFEEPQNIFSQPRSQTSNPGTLNYRASPPRIFSYRIPPPELSVHLHQTTLQLVCR